MTKQDSKEKFAGMDLINILEDINLAPDFRTLADRCVDYYDDNQLSSDEIAARRAKGMPLLIVNLIKPTINTVLGMEEKTRTDWRVDLEADDPNSDEDSQDDQIDLVDGLSAKLHKAQKDSQADKACSEAYAAQVKAGVGWVEVSREQNPYKPKYRVKYIHRNEIDWDWRAREFDLSDARFLVRRKWYDNDVLAEMFPDNKDEIKGSSGAYSVWDNTASLYGASTGLNNTDLIGRPSNINDSEWRDIGRNRTCLFEVWYRSYETVHVMRIKNRVVEFDKTNQMHQHLYQTGMVEVKSAVVDRVRQAYWVGITLLLDRKSPYKHNKFPYVPFFGFREDLTLVPYGLIRSMLSSQDEFNARRAKMYWLLSTQRVTADADAVTDHNVARREMARADSYIILNSKRQPNSKFVISENGSIAKDQFQVMVDAGENIQKTAGIYESMLGSSGSATSGRAIDSLIEQGTTSLGELNGNYRDARMAVGQLLLDLIKDDIGNNCINIKVGKGGKGRVVTLNKPSQSADGIPILENDVQRSMPNVTLDSVPSSATYRQQVARQLIEMTKALPGNIQGLIIDFVIEASDLPKRHEISERIRKALKLDQFDDKPGEKDDAQSQQEQELQAEVQQIQQQAQQAISNLQSKLSDAELKIKQEQAKGFDFKREIEAIKLEEKKVDAAVMALETIPPDNQQYQLLDSLLNEQINNIDGLANNGQ